MEKILEIFDINFRVLETYYKQYEEMVDINENIKEKYKGRYLPRIPLALYLHYANGIEKNEVITDYCRKNNLQMININLSKINDIEFNNIPSSISSGGVYFLIGNDESQPAIFFSEEFKETIKSLNLNEIKLPPFAIAAYDECRRKNITGKWVIKWLFPELLPKGGKGILFLNEISEISSIEILDILNGFILERGIRLYDSPKGYVLPKGWILVAVGVEVKYGYNKNDYNKSKELVINWRTSFMHYKLER